MLLIEAILQNQNLGRLENCLHYQLQLQQNLIYLGVHADKEPEMRALEFTPHPNNRQAPPAATSSAASNATQPPAHAAPAERAKGAQSEADVLYLDGAGRWMPVRILSAHYDAGEPYYTILYAGEQRHTEASRLRLPGYANQSPPPEDASAAPSSKQLGKRPKV